MSEKVLEIKGFEELLKALQDAPQIARPLLEEAMTKSLSQLHDELAQYPAATEANQPGRVDADGNPKGYYERGRGWWYPVRNRSTLGEKLGARLGAETAIRAAKRNQVKNIPTAAGYKLRKQRSEVLGKKWTTAQAVNDTGVLGEIGTTVSYADWVQGDRQAEIHAARDWETASQVLERMTPKIEENFEKAVEKLVEQLGK